MVDEPPDSGLKNAVYCTKPLGYRRFMGYVSRAAAVLTDSGGLQAETTWLSVPCVTLRNETEMPVTTEVGTNTLVGKDLDKIKHSIKAILSGTYRKGSIPDLWDGRTAERIVDTLFK